MLRLILAAALAWLAVGASAQIFECVDAKGKKEYAQQCPPGTVQERRMTKSGVGAPSGGASNPAPQKSLAEQDAAFRKRQMERQEGEAKAAKEQAESKDSERNCNDARAQLKALEAGQRIARFDANTGERSFLEDQDRPGEIAKARQAVEQWCKK